MILTEETVTHSLSESLAGRLSEKHFQILDAPIKVIGSKNVPAIPLNQELENLLKILSPFIPMVTDEVWGWIYSDKNFSASKAAMHGFLTAWARYRHGTYVCVNPGDVRTDIVLRTESASGLLAWIKRVARRRLTLIEPGESADQVLAQVPMELHVPKEEQEALFVWVQNADCVPSHNTWSENGDVNLTVWAGILVVVLLVMIMMLILLVRLMVILKQVPLLPVS